LNRNVQFDGVTPQQLLDPVIAFSKLVFQATLFAAQRE